jgi:hypothetical protein
VSEPIDILALAEARFRQAHRRWQYAAMRNRPVVSDAEARAACDNLLDSEIDLNQARRIASDLARYKL